MHSTTIDDGFVEQIAARTRRAIDALRIALVAEYGWTHLRVRARVRPVTQTIVLEGEVLLESVAQRLRARVSHGLPPGWVPSTAGVRLVADGAWHRLVAPVTRLERGPTPARGLSTELLQGDGPVQLLERHGSARLVRAVDGTVGWTRAPLGRRVVAPRAARIACDLPALHHRLRLYLGVPYRLGGTTPLGIDCSGLAQRAVREALRAILPRHSRDQLRAATTPARAVGEPGDLVYLWAKGESPCHVGIVLAGARGRRTVIHASSSRGRVVEEPLDGFLARADRVAHVELAQVLDGLRCRAMP